MSSASISATELASLKPLDLAMGAGLLEVVDAQRARARHELRIAVDSARYERLLRQLQHAVRSPKVVRTDLSLLAVAVAQFKKLRKTVKAMRRGSRSTDLHAVRSRVKRARYAAELAQPIVGRAAERFIARSKTLQDILGEYHDSVVAEQRLRTLAADDHRSPAALLANRLVGRQRVRRQAA
jgi:CHAD domain-containing protein